MILKKLFLAASACSLAVFAAPASAELKAEAEQCLIDGSNDQVHSLLMNLNKQGYEAPQDVRNAFNRTMLACEQRHGWQRAQTIDAGAYAGFLLRARAEEQAMRARGASASKLSGIRSAAGYLNDGNNRAMTDWLRQNGYRSMTEFRGTPDFAYFNAWMGVLTSQKKLETGSL